MTSTYIEVGNAATAQVTSWPCKYRGFLDFLTHNDHHTNVATAVHCHLTFQKLE
jgi:hypothetical protein